MTPQNITTRLPIAIGLDKALNNAHWKQRSILWGQFCELLEKPVIGEKHEASSYVFGTIVPGRGGSMCDCTVEGRLHRTKKTVVARSALTLDADHLSDAGDSHGTILLEDLVRTGWAWAAHVTWSSEWNDMRLRVVIPLDREVDPGEYRILSRWVMDVLGRGKFDRTCDQASRFMFTPAYLDGSTVEDGDPRSVYRMWRSVSDDFLYVDLLLDLAVISQPLLDEDSDGVDGDDEDEFARSVRRWRGSEQVGLFALVMAVLNSEHGNRDNTFHWALCCARDDGYDPEQAGRALGMAAIDAGLDEGVVWAKVERVLG